MVAVVHNYSSKLELRLKSESKHDCGIAYMAGKLSTSRFVVTWTLADGFDWDIQFSVSSFGECQSPG